MQTPSAEHPPQRRAISSLVDSLEPVRPAGRSGGRCAAWLVLGWLSVIAGVLLIGPLRPGAVSQLATSPHFLIESLVGLGASIVLAAAGFAICIPGPRPLQRAAAAAALLALWIASYLYALWDPALPPSPLGQRTLCEVQVLALGIPLLAAGLWIARGLAPLQPVLSGSLLGAAAGAVPALVMQLACAYLAPHILSHHVLPALAMAALGAALAPRVLTPP